MFVMAILLLLIAAALGYGTWRSFRAYKALADTLKRSGEMSGKATAEIAELVELRRRNRSFRWVNEYPIFAFEAEGKQVKVPLPCAEARRGTYEVGTTYPVRYVPGEPECCIVEELEKKMKRSRTGYLIGTVLLAFFCCNLTVSTLSMLFVGV